MMQSLFSEVFTKPEWLILWDHLFMNSPKFMYFIVVAYLKFFRSALLPVQKERDLKVRHDLIRD
jgi:hypothetical protein